tara:strand:+ start:39 stop:668 length:630 start_codon:yes stop_codon:yes gene_type:complete
MEDYISKLDNSLLPLIKNISKPNILELGVQKGRSTLKFLKICDENDGYLFSVDIDDCQFVSNNPRWKFIKSRDDNFEYINSIIPKKLNIIYIDTVHEASHVKKVFYNYYDYLETGGYIFIDDISHLPYLNNKKSSFYCEINNRETFNEILNIYYYNQKSFNLSFSFESSGLAIIKKKNNDKLNKSKKIRSRQHSFKNIIRKLIYSIKKK